MADTITTAVQSEVAALAHKHLTLTYGLLATLVVVIGLMGVGGYLGLKSFDAQLARQEVRDAQYQTDRTAFLKSLSDHEEIRSAEEAQIAQLQAQIKARDSKPLPKPVQDALKPGAVVEIVAAGLTNAYSDVSSFGAVVVDPSGNIALSSPQAQQVIQSKVDLDKAKGDLGDQKSINSLLNSANSSLTKDLGACKDLNVQANKDIDGYKKLAKRSRWQKFLGGVEKVALLAVGGYVGHLI